MSMYRGAVHCPPVYPILMQTLYVANGDKSVIPYVSIV